MQVECKDNEAFEDQLSKGKTYKVLSVSDNGYLVENDNGVAKWYGNIHFKICGVSL